MLLNHPIQPAPILLVGVGSYRNRGCEAIVRGTMEILRAEFGDGLSVRAGVVASREVALAQKIGERDASIDAFRVAPPPSGPRWSLGWCAAQANQRLGASIYPHLAEVKREVRSPSVALEVGGDNYSLDYGKPLYYLATDRLLQSRGVPVVLWGASVGPFDSDPVFAPRMFDHLRGLSAILVRETESLDYLQRNGVSANVHLMADPAFVMQPIAPPAERIGFELPEGAIGINLSPMVAFYRGGHPADVNLKAWLACCIELVRSAAGLGRPILLIPHVGSSDPGNDDFTLLNSVCNAVSGEVAVSVQVLPDGLDAAELKWVISRCSVFVGARTHSTIASLSSHVPTLSIGYSLKSRGINRDVYGHLDHCLHVSDLNPGTLTERLRTLVAEESAIRTRLRSRIPTLQALAMGAGAVLRRLARREANLQSV